MVYMLNVSFYDWMFLSGLLEAFNMPTVKEMVFNCVRFELHIFQV